jgi:hypothetical protein
MLSYRRFARPHGLLIPLLSLGLSLACLAPAFAADAPTITPAVEHIGPVPILELRGAGAELGQQQGIALGDTIRWLHGQYLQQYLRTPATRLAALAGAAVFEAGLPPDYRDEVHALAQATGVDEKQVMLAQCFLDLSPMNACSTVGLPADASPDRVPRMGRNLDFRSFNIADKQTIVLLFHPTGKYAFASVSWPGMLGVLSGMNEKGLCLANMEVPREVRWPVALPYTLLYRSILERCATVNEAIAMLERTPRQTANNLMLIDAAGDRAVAELTPDAVHVRRAASTRGLYCTNHQRGDDADTPGRCWRYDRLHDLTRSTFGSIDIEQIKELLATASQGEMTMQSMIFEPSDRVLYLATGKDAAHQPYTRLALADRLQSR